MRDMLLPFLKFRFLFDTALKPSWFLTIRVLIGRLFLLLDFTSLFKLEPSCRILLYPPMFITPFVSNARKILQFADL